MPSVFARRKMTRVSDRLRAAREELAATDAQLEFFAEQADDLTVRGLVSEQVLDKRAADEAKRTVENTRRHRERVAAEIARLETQLDQLLDQAAR